MSADDERRIERLLVAYATAIDTHDYALLDRVFVPETRLDYTAVAGKRGTYAELRPWLVKRMARFEVLQHLIGNASVHVEGDAARASCYLRAVHGYREEGELRFFELGGTYDDELARTTDGWRITARSLSHRFTHGTLPSR